MNYIITNNESFFDKIGKYNFCDLEDMVLPEALAVDTETTSLSTRKGDMFAIQIGTGNDNYLVDMQDHNNGVDFKKVIPFIKDKIMVFHNATFDLGFFTKYDLFPKRIYDTMLGSKLLEVGSPPNIRHTFGGAMERHMNIVYDKSEQKRISIVQLKTAKAIEYCFNDVDKLLELCRVIMRKIKYKGMWDTFMLHNNYARALAYIEACGLPINEEKWAVKVKNELELLAEKKLVLENYIYNKLPKYRDTQIDMFDNSERLSVSPTSSKQMIPVFEDLGIDILDQDGKQSLNKDIVSKSKHEFIKIWSEFQLVLHDTTTYGQNILDKVEDGYIFTSYNPILNTARISTRKGGINFLNFPAGEDTRECFEAKEGKDMIVCDYDGQENVVGADLHNDKVMVESILDGKDLHCAFARLLFPELIDVDDAELSSTYSDKRKYAKAPRFTFAYGGNGYTLAMATGISIEEGGEIEAKFKELHSGVYEWGDEVLERALEVGYIESAMGFRFHLPFFKHFQILEEEFESHSKAFWKEYSEGKKQYKQFWDYRNKMENGEDYTVYHIEDPNTYDVYDNNRKDVSKYFQKKSEYHRLCLNNPVQATSAHQTKAAVVRVFDTIIDNNDQWKVEINVVPHDEIAMHSDKDLTDKYRIVLQNAMVHEGNKFLTRGTVFMGATANVGKTWWEAK